MDSKRLVPLSGIVAVALIVGSFAVIGETPDTDDSLEKVVSFYTKHDSDLMLGGVLLALGALFFLFFATNLAGALRRAQGETGGASALSFGGGVMFALGLTIFAGLNFSIGDAGGDIEPAAIQTLHVLGNDFFFPVAVGVSAFMLGSGIAAVKTGVLPKWLGWVAIVIGVVAPTPIGFFAFMASGLWILVASILLFVRSEN